MLERRGGGERSAAGDAGTGPDRSRPLGSRRSRPRRACIRRATIAHSRRPHARAGRLRGHPRPTAGARGRHGKRRRPACRMGGPGPHVQPHARRAHRRARSLRPARCAGPLAHRSGRGGRHLGGLRPRRPRRGAATRVLPGPGGEPSRAHCGLGGPRSDQAERRPKIKPARRRPGNPGAAARLRLRPTISWPVWADASRTSRRTHGPHRRPCASRESRFPSCRARRGCAGASRCRRRCPGMPGACRWRRRPRSCRLRAAHSRRACRPRSPSSTR